MADRPMVIDDSLGRNGRERHVGASAHVERERVLTAEELLFQRLEELRDALPMGSAERSLIGNQISELHAFTRHQRAARAGVFTEAAAKRQ